MPCAGKTYILERINVFEVLSGSRLLKEIEPNFHLLSDIDKESVRRKLADLLKNKDEFIMDGHYAFGDKIAFTENDGDLYDVFIYLYIKPEILRARMISSEKNFKYSQYDIEKWQINEIESLREFCHRHNKDFYVMDDTERGYFEDISKPLSFITAIKNGFSCIRFAEACSKTIIENTKDPMIILSDGDKTMILEDSSSFIGHKSNAFNGNFYTGYQSWIHANEQEEILTEHSSSCIEGKTTWRNSIVEKLDHFTCILTSGYYGIWEKLSKEKGFLLFYGSQMSAETKFYITKILQNEGRYVISYGDSLNDYYMLKKSNLGFLVCKADGSVSRSLSNKSLEGLYFV